MNTMRKLIFILMTALIAVCAAGCWNYREIDKLAVVAGVAVDKGFNDKYKLTVEIVQTTGGRESRTMSELVTMEGKTMFDSVRNGISILGKRMYWSHTKVIIISEEVAKDGIISIIDWYNRDSETRSDIHILISKGVSAGEIFKCQGTTEEIISFELDEVLNNQNSISKAPETDIWELINELAAKGIETTAPSVEVKGIDGRKKARIIGTALFKKDKLIGFLDGEDTRSYLFVKDKVEGGVIAFEEETESGTIPVSLEIFKSKTKLEPVINNNRIVMNVNIDTTVAIDELGGTKDLINEEVHQKLENDTERIIEYNIESLVRKVQSEFGSDIFGFGANIHENRNDEWLKMKDNWDDEFEDLKVNVKASVHIKNSAMMSEPIEVGD